MGRTMPSKMMSYRWIALIASCAAAPHCLAQAPDPKSSGSMIAPSGERLSLDAALTAAQSDNIDVIRARIAVRTAQANLRSADTAPNPTLNLSAVQIRPSSIGRAGVDNLSDSIVGIDLPLERGGKRQARTAQARALIDAAQNDLGSARRDMREAIYDAYFDLKAAEERAATLQAIAASYADSRNIAHTQQRAGALSNGALSRQVVEASRAATDAQQAALQKTAAQLALAILIGREGNAQSLTTATDWPDMATVQSTGEDAVTMALRRPDVMAAQARITAAQRNLDGAHALRYPDVTVSAQYEHAAGDLGVGNSVGVGVSFPLPVRNRYNGEIDAAGAGLVAAETEARKITAIAAAEITMAREALAQSAQRRRDIDQTQLPAAQKAASVAEFAYANGASSLLDLLDARRSLRAVQLGAVDARLDEAHAIARLTAAETTGDNQ